MESKTRKKASRKEVRRSIREFSKQMSEAPAAPAKSWMETNFGLDAETQRLWDMVKAAR